MGAPDEATSVDASTGVTRRFAVTSTAFVAAIVAAGFPASLGAPRRPSAGSSDAVNLRTPTRAGDIVDRMGVAMHTSYTDSQYRDIDFAIEALRYLGLDRIRDQTLDPGNDLSGQLNYGKLAQAGMKFCLYTYKPVPEQVALLRAFEEAHPGAIEIIEGPNEVNNWPISHGGRTGPAGAVAYVAALCSAVRSDPVLGSKIVAGHSNWPPNATVASYNTIHSYPKHGDQPLAELTSDRNQQETVDPGKPYILTETGYHTKIDPANGWEGVSEAVHAKLILNLYMDALRLGIRRTYIYQLFDAYEDRGNDQEKHFGLCRLDNSYKPAAVAIHNFTTILADRGRDARTFPLAALGTITVSGAPASGYSFLVQKSDGSYWVITWAEPDIWNQNTNTEIAARAVRQTIGFGRTFANVSVYDPLIGTDPVATASAASSVVVGITDHPLIVKLSD
ncbi:MAG: calcium-binding protein [Rhodospirillales bacterium]|nr:calcium-binding protein [Rhodospirillales bacterium]